jgi:hypothetical protein
MIYESNRWQFLARNAVFDARSLGCNSSLPANVWQMPYGSSIQLAKLVTTTVIAAAAAKIIR